MQFVYIGTDGAADPTGTLAFGIWFPIGEPVHVESERVIMKLIGHPHFEAVEGEDAADDADAAAPKKRGRPRKGG